MKRFTFVTGQPIVGKTNILLRVAKGLKKKGIKMVAWSALKLARRGWLAHVNQFKGPKVEARAIWSLIKFSNPYRVVAERSGNSKRYPRCVFLCVLYRTS